MIALYGGTGFIGSEFCKKYECYVVPKFDISPPENTEKILYMISTVDNYNVLSNPYIDIETNLTHLIRVLESIKGKSIEFTFVSSWFVYGDTDLPAKESSHCSPKGFYSITKRTAEQLIESYCKTFNIPYKIVRLSNIVGIGDGKVSKKKNALQYLINEMRLGRNINLYNNGEFYRDLIHVEDAADGIKFVMDNGILGEIYNLGSGEKIKFKEVIDYLHEKLNSSSKIGTMEPSEFHKIVQVESMYLDVSKVTELGFKPKNSVFQTLLKLI